MKFLNILKHAAVIIAAVIVVIGVPLLCTGYIQSLLSGGVDVVSSASIVLDEPSGDFIALINKDLHPDEDTLADWVKFFGSSSDDGELVIIFEDIACSVPRTDAAGAEMADSLRSQLPENQMKVTKEDATLIVSRADKGLFDMIIMSKEFAENYHLETAVNSNVQVIEISGGGQEDETD